MPQLASAMTIPLSCPLYLDLGAGLTSEANYKSNFDVQDNSKGMLDMNFLYENLLKSQPNMYQFNPNLFAESFNYYLNQSCRNGDKSISPKSFSIESILNSSSQKDIFCNQLTFPEYPAKNSHYQATEFATNNVNYRPLSCHEMETTKAKDQMAANKTANIAIPQNNCKVEKVMGNLKHYPGLNRKSTKAFKTNTKVLSSQSKSKRVRTIFTPEQLERLETEFERQQYMVGTGRHYLASTLNLTEAQVKVWFQNRRIKWRKQHLDGQDKNGKNENELL